MSSKKYTVEKNVAIEYWDKSFRIIVKGYPTSAAVFIDSKLSEAVLQGLAVIVRDCIRYGASLKEDEIKKALGICVN